MDIVPVAQNSYLSIATTVSGVFLVMAMGALAFFSQEASDD